MDRGPRVVHTCLFSVSQYCVPVLLNRLPFIYNVAFHSEEKEGNILLSFKKAMMEPEKIWMTGFFRTCVALFSSVFFILVFFF